MEEPERVREIARMLSGATLTETSLRHAENLLPCSVTCEHILFGEASDRQVQEEEKYG